MSQIGGRYEILRRTGNHGIAVLYEAFDPVMNRPVSIWVDGESTETTDDHVFAAANPANLDHPNIVKVLAWEKDADRPYLVLEHFEGKTLASVLASGGSLPLARVTAILKSVAAALDHVHGRGLIHRQLTPEHLLLGEDDQVKVAGMELACAPEQLYSEVTSDAPDEHAHLWLDAVPYLAPELLLGESVDRKCDQYSLAIIAYQALTGRLPYTASSPLALLGQATLHELDLSRGSVPLGIAKVLERALSTSPSARFASCVELFGALQAASVERVAGPTRVAPMPPPGSPPQSGRTATHSAPPANASSRLWMIVGGLVVLAALLVFGIRSVLKSGAPPVNQATPVVPVNPPGVTPAASKAAPKQVPTATAPKQAKPKAKASVVPAVEVPAPAAKAPPAKAPETKPAAVDPPKDAPVERPKLRPVEPKVVQP